ncbi:hypothetical protein MNBD_GAMMA20-1597 [hydrothermal vent metagenome]|uniref:Uncharacterized protein n=1 Tax=hydrothermal vent metagenome TaxID=652676 RepID=A0A3B1AL89_9ZZZZ
MASIPYPHCEQKPFSRRNKYHGRPWPIQPRTNLDGLALDRFNFHIAPSVMHKTGSSPDKRH